MITATNYRCGPDNGRPLCIFDLHLEPSGIVLHDCMLYEVNGKRWISLPAKPQVTKDGQVLLSPKTGKISYSACISIDDRDRREIFQKAALAALTELQSREGAR